ncbi:(S)-benzoin forming benzil reductase [Oceanobacillus kimchii]|uniref:(S)-benzoin forming benzil reductase n=1 Tax=Oceanobacillus kimchii TaxID=746691 RepID=UPI003B01E31B
MKTAIVTGVSKGLGESIAKLYLESGVMVIGVSRTDNKALYSIAENNNTEFHHVACDLSDISEYDSTFNKMDEILFQDNVDTIYLVNNAGIVDPIEQAKNIKNVALQKHLQVNSFAPMAFTNYYLKKAEEHEVTLITAIVTSGAAQKPKFGWSAYCSSKASMNMYTETVALEQDEEQTGHKIIAFSPGVMDTNMQETIRSSSKEAFKDVEDFKGLKDNNLLKDTDLIAGVLIDIMTDEKIKNGKIYDVKDYI